MLPAVQTEGKAAKWLPKITERNHSLTFELGASRLAIMIGKKLFLLLMAGAVLFLQAADCMNAISQDQQAVQCCGTSQCTPANQSQGCCKTMTSTEMPRMLVKARVSLNVPLAAIAEQAPALKTAMFMPSTRLSFEPQQYSPPELYTLHSSLLI